LNPSDPAFPDVDTLRLRDSDIPCVRVKTAAHRRRHERFYQIQESQFQRACRLPGKSLAVYMILLRRSLHQKQRTLKLSTSLLREFGISRDQKAVALGHLERAGLIRVLSQRRKNPVVTLLDVPYGEKDDNPPEE
jgi:hypothetical protein